MGNVLSKFRDSQRPKEKRPSNTLSAYLEQALQGYWDRQGRMANEGLQMADQGAQAVQAGNMGGLAGMLLGPAAYIGSPVSALFPERSEVEAATDVPEWSKPWLAGGLETMAIMAPGPKGKGLGRGLNELTDAATDAERAALGARLEGEAVQAAGPDLDRLRAEGFDVDRPIYHGTADDFDAFDPSLTGKVKKSDWGDGSYFTPSESTADYYRTEAVKHLDQKYNEAFQRYENLAKTTTTWKNGTPTYTKETEDALREFQRIAREVESDKTRGRVVSGYARMRNPWIEHSAGGSYTDPNLAARAKAKGHDSLIIRNPHTGEDEEILLFNPRDDFHQIRPAQTGGQASAVTRDQALRNLTEAPEAKPKKGLATQSYKETLPDGSTRWLPGTLRVNPPKQVFDPEMSPAYMRQLGLDPSKEYTQPKGMNSTAYKVTYEDGTMGWVPGLMRAKRPPK